MNKFGLTFHHFGLATASEEKAINFLKGLDYTIPEYLFDPLQNVNLRMCIHEQQPNVELVSKAETSGPLKSILSTNDAMIYHICYSSVNVEQSVTAIKTSGHRMMLISPPKPAVLFNNRFVSFYIIRGIGLVEILDVSNG